MNQRISQIRAELRLLYRERTFPGLIFLLFFLMSFAVYNTNDHLVDKGEEVETQLNLVRKNDQALAAQIDSLKNGLATYQAEYTLPTSGGTPYLQQSPHILDTAQGLCFDRH